MSQTILLARVLGLFLIIIGALVMIRRHYFIEAFAAFAAQRMVRVILAMMMVLAGLFLVISHNDWSSAPAGIISAVGWIVVVEGIVYASLPDERIGRLMVAFNVPAWYLLGGVLAVAVGIYLAGHGFGVWP